MKLPKLPNGPSGPGSAAVRGLEGFSFQTKRSADYVARVKDDFARVELAGGINYVSLGRHKIDTAPQTFGAQHPANPFRRVPNAAGTNCDQGEVAFALAGAPAVTVGTYSYPDQFNAPQPATFIRKLTLQQIFIGPRNSAALCGSLTFGSSHVDNGLSDYSARDSLPPHYVGRVLKGGLPDVQTAVFFLADEGRTDAVGRPLYDPACAFFYKKALPEAFLLPVPFTGDAEFEQPAVTITKDCIYVVLAEKGRHLGLRNPALDLRPPVWLMTSLDGGATWSAVNIRAAVGLGESGFGSLSQRVAVKVSPGASDYRDLASIALVDGLATIADPALYSSTYTRVLSIAPEVTESVALNPTDVGSYQSYNTALAQMFKHARMVVLGADVSLLVLPQMKVIRISASGTAVANVYTEALGFGGNTHMLQSVVHTGAGRLIAKRADGPDTFFRSDLDVSFMASADAGATWASYSPIGFASPLKNLYFGELFVESAFKPRPEGDKPARVLMPMYDFGTAGVATYRVFSSDTDGATWKRRGLMARPDTFYRVDSIRAGDGGGNFAALNYVGQDRPVDPALPDRYTRKSQL